MEGINGSSSTTMSYDEEYDRPLGCSYGEDECVCSNYYVYECNKVTSNGNNKVHILLILCMNVVPCMMFHFKTIYYHL